MLEGIPLYLVFKNANVNKRSYSTHWITNDTAVQESLLIVEMQIWCDVMCRQPSTTF